MPREHFGIFEQNSPESHEIPIGRTLLIARSLEELIELDEPALGSIHRDAALAAFRAAIRAEARDAGCGPASANHIVERSHALAAPDDAGHLIGILQEIRFDSARQLSAIVRMIPARTVGALAIDI